MKWLKQLYHWVLHWAKTPYGSIALFALAFAESSVFPIPPDVLLIAMALGANKKAFRFALICTVGSVLGGLAGYLIGYQFWEVARPFFLKYVFSDELFFKVQTFYHQNAFLFLFISGFTPVPYKVFTITAGVFNLSLLTFIAASILGRALRFYLVVTLIWFWGDKVKSFIDKYFEMLALLFGILLIGGFIVIKYLYPH